MQTKNSNTRNAVLAAAVAVAGERDLRAVRRGDRVGLEGRGGEDRSRASAVGVHRHDVRVRGPAAREPDALEDDPRACLTSDVDALLAIFERIEQSVADGSPAGKLNVAFLPPAAT